MEEQTVRSEGQSMSYIFTSKALRCVAPFLIAALWILLPTNVAHAQRQPRALEPGRVAPSSPDLGVASAIRLSQLGDESVLLTVKGLGLTHPRVLKVPGMALVLEWEGTRFPQNTDRRDWWQEYGWDVLMLQRKQTGNWWREYNVPLVQRIVAESNDQQLVRLNIIGPQPLKVEKVDGMSGSDQLVLTLKQDRPAPILPPPPGPRVLAPGDPMAIKAPVTMEFRDVPLQDIFRMLAAMQKLNLVIDPSVPAANVTLSFSGIPFSEAFSYLLRMNDLTYSMMGKTLVVGTPQSIGKTLGNNIKRGYQLSYGDLAQLPALLTGLVSLSDPPVVDTRMRTMYVTASQEQHTEIAQILARLDNPGRQVMIFSQILEVADNASQELDKAISAVYNQWAMNFEGGQLTLEGGYSNKEGLLTPSVSGAPLYSGVKLLQAIVTATEDSSKIKNLANPSVITVDGKKAKIDLQNEVLYVSGRDDRGNPEYGTASEGPLLEFTPVIGRDGIITLELKVTAGTLTFKDSGGFQVPATQNRSVETLIRVKTGQPFVVGGLHTESKTKGVKRIPVLGSLPLLGSFFKTRSDIHNRSEVVMIVVPYILDVPETQINTHDLPKTARF